MLRRLFEQSRKNFRTVALILPALIYVIVFLIIPYALLIPQSFTHYTSYGFSGETYFTLENFENVLSYGSVFLRTLRISLALTVLCLVFGFPVAYFLAHTEKRRSLYIFFLIAPIMSGVIARTYGWYALLGRVGIINQFLLVSGIISEPLALLFTENAIIVGLLEINLPFMIIPIMSSLLQIGPDVEQAARTLGANRLQVFLRITLPLCLPGIVSGSILCFTLGLGAFATPLFLGGATNQVLTMLVYDEVMTILNWPFSSAILLVLVVIVVIPAGLYLKMSRR